MDRQDRRRKRASIGVESLEGRQVLSTGGGLIAPMINPGGPVRGINFVDLQGSTHGSTSTVVGNPDVGTTDKFHGKGHVSGLGQVKLSGSLHGTGFIASSHVEGTITLSNGKGSLTLQLEGSGVGGFTAPKSGTYTFHTLSGTGAFKHDLGYGRADLALGSRSFTLTLHGGPNVY